jgi:uncharacterized protein (TIGR02996 family)
LQDIVDGTAMSEDELLDAICAAPDRNEPRLAYAAWLEEQGNPWCELIRASCTPGGEARAQEILAEYADYWSEQMRRFGLELSGPPHFERGFIAELPVIGSFGDLLEDFAEAIAAMRPVPVALILGADRVLLRADRRAFAFQSRADNQIVIGSLPDQRELATLPPCPGPVQMLGFVGDRLIYRVGNRVRELLFLS